MPISERKKEIRRRRKRRENYADMKAKLPKADAATKTKMVEKLKKLSPGADVLIEAWGLK
jgi:L-alanine-DL-glutamate epimerase-like enolase superfamily enzyme